jgi:glycerol kinase
VVRPKILETTALGAAYLAGLTVSLWASRDEIAAQWQVGRRYEPAMARDEAADRLTRWREAVSRSRDWARPD